MKSINKALKNDIYKNFTNCYKNISNILEKYLLVNRDVGINAFAFVYSIHTLALKHAGKSEHQYAVRIFDFISPTDIDRFKFYTDLYSDVLNGLPLRDECSILNSEFNESKTSIITKISVAFIDTLYNPDCINDYRNAPTLMQELDKQMSFNDLFQIVFYLANDYYLMEANRDSAAANEMEETIKEKTTACYSKIAETLACQNITLTSDIKIDTIAFLDALFITALSNFDDLHLKFKMPFIPLNGNELIKYRLLLDVYNKVAQNPFFLRDEFRILKKNKHFCSDSGDAFQENINFITYFDTLYDQECLYNYFNAMKIRRAYKEEVAYQDLFTKLYDIPIYHYKDLVKCIQSYVNTIKQD